MKFLIILQIILFAYCVQADEQLTRKLIIVMEADDKAYNSIIEEIEITVKKSPEMEGILACANKMVTKELITDRLVPIYKGVFSKEEAEFIIEFLSSDLGKRMKALFAKKITQEAFYKSMTEKENKRLQAYTTKIDWGERTQILSNAFTVLANRLSMEWFVACSKELD